MVLTDKSNICVHACPSNRNADERFWEVGHWAELINRIKGNVAFIGTQVDKPYYNRIWELVENKKRIFDLMGYELWEVGCYIMGMDLSLCVNSGIMHLSYYVGTPLVAIVGGTPAKIILPPDNPKVKWLEDPELRWWNPQDSHNKKINSRLSEVLPEMVMEKINEL